MQPPPTCLRCKRLSEGRSNVSHWNVNKCGTYGLGGNQKRKRVSEHGKRPYRSFMDDLCLHETAHSVLVRLPEGKEAQDANEVEEEKEKITLVARHSSGMTSPNHANLPVLRCHAERSEASLFAFSAQPPLQPREASALRTGSDPERAPRRQGYDESKWCRGARASKSALAQRVG